MTTHTLSGWGRLAALAAPALALALTAGVAPATAAAAATATSTTASAASVTAPVPAGAATVKKKSKKCTPAQKKKWKQLGGKKYKCTPYKLRLLKAQRAQQGSGQQGGQLGGGAGSQPPAGPPADPTADPATQPGLTDPAIMPPTPAGVVVTKAEARTCLPRGGGDAVTVIWRVEGRHFHEKYGIAADAALANADLTATNLPVDSWFSFDYTWRTYVGADGTLTIDSVPILRYVYATGQFVYERLPIPPITFRLASCTI